jgi:hypothetical protein
MPIKLIAPLEPAGEFPVASANNIELDLNLGEGSQKNVEYAVQNLYRQIGIGGDVQEDSLATRLTTLSGELQADSDEILKQITDSEDALDKAITAAKDNISSKVTSLGEALIGTTTPGLLNSENNGLPKIINDTNLILQRLGEDNVKEKFDQLATAVGGVTTNLTNVLVDLRKHINTISPPTLTASHDGTTVYKVCKSDDASSLVVTAKVNRPLELPLQLKIGDTLYNTNPDEPTLTYTQDWKPYSTTIGTKTISVKIVDQDKINGEELVYGSYKVSCAFSAPTYYWSVDPNAMLQDAKDDPTKDSTASILQEDAIEADLAISHPSEVKFTHEGAKYCYYACPKDFVTPSFYLGTTDQTSGFTCVAEEVTETINGCNILYNIYRTNKALTSATFKIK